MPTTKAEARAWYRAYTGSKHVPSRSMRAVAAAYGTTAATVATTFRRYGWPVRDRSERSAAERQAARETRAAAILAGGRR